MFFIWINWLFNSPRIFDKRRCTSYTAGRKFYQYSFKEVILYCDFEGNFPFEGKNTPHLFFFFFLIFVIVYSSLLKIVSSFTFYFIWKQVWDDSLNVNFLFITYWISYRVFKQLKNTKTTDVWLLNSNNSWKRLLKNPYYLKRNYYK